MDFLLTHWLGVALFLAYSALLVWNARLGSAAATVEEYFVGGRRLGGLVVGCSFFATYASTNSYIGNAGKAYEFGAPWLLLVVFMVVFCWLSWRFVAPRLAAQTRAQGSITLPEYFGARFASGAARRTAGLLVVFASFFYMTAVYKGAGHLLETFLAIPYQAAVAMVLVLVMAYTAVGGFVTVVRTDVVQGGMMLCGALVLGIGSWNAAGGTDALLQVANNPETAHLFSWDAAMPFPVLFGILTVASMKLVVDPRQLTRFFAVRDQKAVDIGLWVSLAGIILIFGMLLPVGLLAQQLLPGLADSDLVVPRLVGMGVFSVPATDFLVVAMLAAAMSSLDSVLLATASVAARDLGLESNRLGLVGTTRLLVVLLALVPAVIALWPPAGIVELTIFSGSVYAGCFLPALVVGLWGSSQPGRGVALSFLVGAAMVGLWRWSPWADRVHEVFPAVAASALVLALACWVRRLMAAPGR